MKSFVAAPLTGAVIIMVLITPLLFLSNPAPYAQARDSIPVSIVFQDKTDLRVLAAEFMGHPDEWQTILFFNGLKHPSDLRPGMKLFIPVDLHHDVLAAIDQADKTARTATGEGAGILARETIDEAEAALSQARDLKKKGDLKSAMASAKLALQKAEAALSVTKAKKFRSVSAILSRKTGTVQSRKPKEPVWKDARLKQELVEQERLRTLAASRAGVLFVDGSEIRMDENSLAVIGEMKENLVRQSLSVDVLVIKGDILTQLSSLSGQKQFSVEAPGVKTDVRSMRFRTTRDAAQATRIANYDGEIDVTAQQQRVTIKKDEGTKVEKGRAPSPPRKLPPPPDIVAPLKGQVFFSQTVTFKWQPVEKALSYVLEISDKRSFATLIHTVKTSDTHYEWQAETKGLYYYRIFTIDQDRFAGPHSKPTTFLINIDVTPPYLVVHSPEDGQILTDCECRVRGVAETYARLAVNGVAIQSDENGAFDHPISLTPGQQTIIVTAQDQAGNQTTVARSATCAAGKDLISLETPHTLVVNVDRVALEGTLGPNARLEINGESLSATPHRFVHTLELSEGEHVVTVKATSEGGAVQTVPVRVVVDTTPPEIQLKDFPSVARKNSIQMSGRLSEPARLTLAPPNAASVTIDVDKDLSFDLPLDLTEGDNVFSMTATDAAGNRTDRSFQILMDTTPPDIQKVTIFPEKVESGDLFSCRVLATDKGVGLAGTGRFTVSIGYSDATPEIFRGVLTLDRAANELEGIIFIPPGVSGPVSIVKIEIQDRLGNSS